MDRTGRVPGLHAVGGVDHAIDPVVRREEFLALHPEVKITGPRENDRPAWRARWADGMVQMTAEAAESMDLLGVLEHWFDSR